MALFDEAKAVARRSGRPEDAVRFIEDKAKAGDGEANLIVAHWLLYGSDRPRDPVAARSHLETAAAQGSTHAARVLANLVGGGIGSAPDLAKAVSILREIAGRDELAAAQLRLLAAMPDEDQSQRAVREPYCDDPPVALIRGLLTAAECEYVMRIAAPVLKPSFVYEPGAERGKADPIRKSEGAALLPHDEDLVIQAINRRLAVATRTHVDQREALYVIRYRPGEEYRPHFDALPGLANQRALTAICYLNDGYSGGSTCFPELGLSIAARAGDVLVFANVDEEGRPDKRTRHAGEVVTEGVKWIATRWIRQRAHDPYDHG